MSRKSWRTPVAKPGEIKIVYGKVDRHSNPHLCVAWGPGTDMKCTGRLIMNAITEKPLRHKFPGGGTEYTTSLADELEARGFDITTLLSAAPPAPWRDSMEGALADAIALGLASWDASRREWFLAVPVGLARKAA